VQIHKDEVGYFMVLYGIQSFNAVSGGNDIYLRALEKFSLDLDEHLNVINQENGFVHFFFHLCTLYDQRMFSANKPFKRSLRNKLPQQALLTIAVYQSAGRPAALIY